MGKQKQQVISRFFASKPKTTPLDSVPIAQNPSPPRRDPSPTPYPPTHPPKIATTVSFSPAKRKLLSAHLVSASASSSSATPKKPKLSPHTHNAIPSLPNPSLHEKFLRKLLEPSSSSSELPIVHSSDSQKLTPLEQQVVELKKKYPDVLLMIEVGYKFRFFGEDAEIAAKVLGIYAHMDHSFLTASVPTFRLNIHVRRLVGAGYKVGVVKQTETAAIKAHGSNRSAPFTRSLSALYTKATLEAAEDVEGKEEGCGSENNYLVCIVDKSADLSSSASAVDVRIGIVGVEISTGDVVYGEFEDGVLRSGLEGVLLSLAPAELLLGDPLSKQTEKMLTSYAGPASNVRVEHAFLDSLRDGGALAEVISLYEDYWNNNLVYNEKQSIEVLENQSHCPTVEEVMKMPDLAVQALALAIRHFKQFGFERILCHGASFRPLSNRMDMTLSANALQQLEVLRNNSDGGETGSLLHMMNHTLTIYGSRLLRNWVAHPLSDRNMISARLDAVSEIAESICPDKVSYHSVEIEREDIHTTRARQELYTVLLSVLTALGRQTDLQRGITRIFHRTATPKEFVEVIQAILIAGKQLQRLQLDEAYKNENIEAWIVQSSLLRKMISTASSSCLLANAAKLLASLNREAADQGDLLNLLNISNGQFSEVASAHQAVRLAKEKLESLICLFRKRLGIQNLEYMNVSGTTHLIEVSLDTKVPLSWVKVNSTKKTVRYQPPEVIAALDQLTLASEELTISCRAAWDNFLRKFSEYYAEFHAAVQALAALDCLLSLATLSRNKKYVRPEFVGDHDPVQIQIYSGRHPVLETVLQDSFVPNDTTLHQDMEHCQIITGPNMGGKSCYIRQVALICLMAQVGSYVPASSAKLHVLDGIYTRMGASDNIQLGRSTFLEELSEASQILQNCTENSLVVLDELGRGTSTHDGVAVAYATLHYLLEKKRCMVLFVTHYPKISDIRASFPGSVEAYHVSYLTSEDRNTTTNTSDPEEVTYLYKLVPGIAARSFGFKVAKLAQMPQECISRAIVMASRLEESEKSRVRSKLGENQRLLTGIKSDQDQEATDHESEISSNVYTGRQQLEGFTVSFRDLLLELESAVCDDNLSKCCQLLEASQRTARHLLNRWR